MTEGRVESMRLELERGRDDLAAFLRASWNSAHAQYEISQSHGLKREYDGRIAAIERIAEHVGVQLTEARFDD